MECPSGWLLRYLPSWTISDGVFFFFTLEGLTYHQYVLPAHLLVCVTVVNQWVLSISFPTPVFDRSASAVYYTLMRSLFESLIDFGQEGFKNGLPEAFALVKIVNHFPNLARSLLLIFLEAALEP